MASFYIKFGGWDDIPGRGAWEVPTFLVLYGGIEKELLFAVNVLHSFSNEIREEKFKQALLCHAVQRIEQGLRDNIFSSRRTSESQRISITETERPFLERLLQEKICTYQLHEGRDLLCSAADINDPGKVGQIGFRTVAPTSRATCRTCALPNTDYLCSHLVRPLVRSCPAHDTSLLARLLVGASCNLERDEIRGGTGPSFCRAGGHQCWERILEPQSASSEIITGIGHTMDKSRDIHISISGSTIHGNVVGDVSGENAAVTYNHNDLSALEALISDLFTRQEELPLTTSARTQLKAQLQTIQDQIAAQAPNHSSLREALHTLRHMLEAGAAHVLVGQLLPFLHTPG